MAIDLNLRVSGQAGQGVDTLGTLLAEVLHADGLHLFTHQDYMSRIRGGHNYYQLRIADQPLTAAREKLDLIVALDERGLQEDWPVAGPRPVVLVDGEFEQSEGLKLRVPWARLAEEAGDARYANTAAAGAALAQLGHPLETLLARLEATFARRGPEVVAGNQQAARAGYAFHLEHFSRMLPLHAPVLPPHGQLLLSGVEAIALAALAGGVQFYSGYPMTPTTGILTYLAQHADGQDLVVEQAEDEIAAINMCLGAAYGGARAMTATSGGGFCLMVEGLALAGMTETPIVIALGQRPGPATGLPTRTEQGELWFALHAGHGEFPRLVYAPGDPTEAFELTFLALNQADKYQTPALLLYDQYLADMTATVPRPDFSGLTVDRHLATAEEIGGDYQYARYALTDSGVSPRALPGTPGAVVEVDSDEHDVHGHIIEDAETRKAMVDKRLRKSAGMRQDMLPPLLTGDAEPDLLLLGWGSTKGCLAEAAALLRQSGERVAQLHCPQLWPFPAEAMSAVLQSARRTFVIENNATGQFRGLISRETGICPDELVAKYDGQPFAPQEIVAAVRSRRREKA
ncbi:MAG TPA: 2-oxoacid:acceptor oxidoreductase subunit alpha [Armatimonadota bacterium]|jgi:2-oxoglutarate ferredoxin oxidoreductase subunit alpha